MRIKTYVEISSAEKISWVRHHQMASENKRGSDWVPWQSRRVTLATTKVESTLSCLLDTPAWFRQNHYVGAIAIKVWDLKRNCGSILRLKQRCLLKNLLRVHFDTTNRNVWIFSGSTFEVPQMGLLENYLCVHFIMTTYSCVEYYTWVCSNGR